MIATAPHPGTIVRPHVHTTAAASAPTAKQLIRSNKFEDLSDDCKPVNPYQDIVDKLFSNKSQSVVTQVQAISQTTRHGRQIYPNSKYGYLSHNTEAYSTNLKKLISVKDRKDAIRASIMEEISNLLAPEIMKLTPIHLIRPENRPEIINLWQFVM